MELLTPLETICRLILRAKELEAQVPAAEPDQDPDDIDDLDDDGEGAATLSVLEDELNDGVEEEVRVTSKVREIAGGRAVIDAEARQGETRIVRRGEAVVELS